MGVMVQTLLARRATWFAGLRGMLRAMFPLLPAALLPLSFRLIHMAEAGASPRIFDIGGVLADLGLGLAVSLLLVMALRARLILFAVGLALWLALNAGYYEFLRVYDSPYFLIHVGNMLSPAFVEGSGTELSHPWFLALAALVTLASLYAGRHSLAGARSGRLAWVAISLLAVVQILPQDNNAPVWRQRNLVSSNLADVGTRVIAPAFHAEASGVETPELAAFLRPDLDGKPILQAAGKRNVIIVFVESMSGGQLPSLAAAHGNTSVLELGAMDAIARDGLSFSTFITHQKQSNRGLFGALCGAYPHLASMTPDMSEVANGFARRCLPEVLKQNGYATLFLKAADSSYMQMGAFMQKIGFERAFGAEGFDPSLPRGRWGLDDATLYAESLKQIDALAKGDQPFFLTLFTSSTHHPFAVPESFTDKPGQPDRERAFAFADRSEADFIAALNARGILDDTLVLLTSDEASPITEPTYRKDDLLNGMTENWGLMVALSPERATGRIDTPFQQSDLPLSVLDYLGLGAQGDGFIGRSLFRRYDTPRPAYFANVYKSRSYEYLPGQELSVCDEALTGCTRYDASKGGLFSNDLVVTQRDAPASPMMRAVVDHSLLPAGGSPEG